MTETLVQDRPTATRVASPGTPPRVLLAFDWFWKYAAPQAVALRRAGAPVAILHRTHLHEFAGRADERDTLLSEVRSTGVEAFAVPGRFTSIGALPRIAAVGVTLRGWRPDIVHAHDNYDPRLLALTRGLPLVLTIHDPRPHLGAVQTTGVRARIRRAWLRRADRIVVHGEALRDELTATVPAERIAVVPHGTDVASEPAPMPDQPLVLLFGRLEAYKGVGVLADAMRLVWSERADVRLVVAGSGPEARRVPEDSRVELLEGYVPEAALDELFARASLIVLPYLDASQSGVGLQAIARGIPVVVTNVGSLPDLAPDRALIVPPRDPEALAAGIVVALEHDGELRRRTLEHARRFFSWDVVAHRSLALYRDVMAR
jgi:glycosyltransferase involved in cell wall biosynthesis